MGIIQASTFNGLESEAIFPGFFYLCVFEQFEELNRNGIFDFCAVSNAFRLILSSRISRSFVARLFLTRFPKLAMSSAISLTPDSQSNAMFFSFGLIKVMKNHGFYLN